MKIHLEKKVRWNVVRYPLLRFSGSRAGQMTVSWVSTCVFISFLVIMMCLVHDVKYAVKQVVHSLQTRSASLCRCLSGNLIWLMTVSGKWRLTFCGKSGLIKYALIMRESSTQNCEDADIMITWHISFDADICLCPKDFWCCCYSFCHSAAGKITGQWTTAVMRVCAYYYCC